MDQLTRDSLDFLNGEAEKVTVTNGPCFPSYWNAIPAESQETIRKIAEGFKPFALSRFAGVLETNRPLAERACVSQRDSTKSLSETKNG